MEGLDQTLGGVTIAQSQQLQLAEENLKSVGQLQNDSQALHIQLEHALQNEVSQSCGFFSGAMLRLSTPASKQAFCRIVGAWQCML